MHFVRWLFYGKINQASDRSRNVGADQVSSDFDGHSGVRERHERQRAAARGRRNESHTLPALVRWVGKAANWAMWKSPSSPPIHHLLPSESAGEQACVMAVREAPCLLWGLADAMVLYWLAQEVPLAPFSAPSLRACRCVEAVRV